MTWWHQYIHGHLLATGTLAGALAGLQLGLSLQLGPPHYIPTSLALLGFILGTIPAHYWTTAYQLRTSTHA